MTAALRDPVIGNDGAAYWDRCNQGRLTFQQCRACGHRQFFSRSCCSNCLSDDLAREPARGDAVIVSFSHVHGGEPFTIALVRLAEGVSMLTRLVDMAAADVAIGAAVRLRFEASPSGTNLPCFGRP